MGIHRKIPYKRGRISELAKTMFKAPPFATENPIRSKVRLVPFHTMVLGDAFYFYVDEMSSDLIALARATARKYANEYGARDMFGFVKHRDDFTRKYYMLEIVRIK